jgi:hypothetical protein
MSVRNSYWDKMIDTTKTVTSAAVTAEGCPRGCCCCTYHEEGWPWREMCVSVYVLRERARERRTRVNTQSRKGERRAKRKGKLVLLKRDCNGVLCCNNNQCNLYNPTRFFLPTAVVLLQFSTHSMFTRITSPATTRTHVHCPANAPSHHFTVIFIFIAGENSRCQPCNESSRLKSFRLSFPSEMIPFHSRPAPRLVRFLPLLVTTPTLVKPRSLAENIFDRGYAISC